MTRRDFGSRAPETAPEIPNMLSKCFKIAPRRPHEAPNGLQWGPEEALGTPKRSPNDPRSGRKLQWEREEEEGRNQSSKRPEAGFQEVPEAGFQKTPERLPQAPRELQKDP